MLFNKIPERLFSILTSPNKELYVEALFVLRQAFKLELVIRRTDLISMLLDSLENSILYADFSADADEGMEETEGLSGKAHFLFRKLMDTGWLETEYEKNSYEENVTIPDYAIKIINVLYDLTTEEKKEYNSYVFATYSALKSTDENRDYLYQALNAAYRNTVQLLDELKSLFNNIKRYHLKITDELGVNDLLEEHFDLYKEKIIDTIYYPLKTIDSVPRFKNSIIMILNEWAMSEEVLQEIIRQGINSRVYTDPEQARDEVMEKINYIVDTYEGIEVLINNIDSKHIDYTNVSIDKMRYLLNSDRSIKGKLVYLLKHSDQKPVIKRLTEYVEFYQHMYVDENSLSPKLKRSRKKEGKPMKVVQHQAGEEQIADFIKSVKNQYGTQKIDHYILGLFDGKSKFTSADIEIDTSEEFILFMLGTIRGTERRSSYQVEFFDGAVTSNGYRIPNAEFSRKEDR